MQITSLISGPHVKDSAHFAGRAVDISLPHTADAWRFLVAQMKSGKWARIGTTAAFANDPQVQSLAKSLGVQVFVDEGTGSHVHLEVSP